MKIIFGLFIFVWSRKYAAKTIQARFFYRLNITVVLSVQKINKPAKECYQHGQPIDSKAVKCLRKVSKPQNPSDVDLWKCDQNCPKNRKDCREFYYIEDNLGLIKPKYCRSWVKVSQQEIRR